MRKKHNTSAQNVKQMNDETLVGLWENSPRRLKKKFPRTKLMTGRVSKLRGRSRDVFELMQEGKSPKEIAEAMSATGNELGRIRKILKDRSLDLGYVARRGKYLISSIEGSVDDGKTQELLDSITRRMLIVIKRDSPGLLMNITNLVKKGGYHASNRQMGEFAGVLKKGGVPIGTIEIKSKIGTEKEAKSRYYFMAARDEKRADRVIRDNHKFDRLRGSPAKVIYGPVPEKAPTIWDFRKPKGMLPVRPIISKFGVHLPGGIKKSGKEFFGQDCPVTVFGYQAGHYCREEDAPKLEEFIKKKLSKRQPSN